MDPLFEGKTKWGENPGEGGGKGVKPDFPGPKNLTLSDTKAKHCKGFRLGKKTHKQTGGRDFKNQGQNATPTVEALWVGRGKGGFEKGRQVPGLETSKANRGGELGGRKDEQGFGGHLNRQQKKVSQEKGGKGGGAKNPRPYECQTRPRYRKKAEGGGPDTKGKRKVARGKPKTSEERFAAFVKGRRKEKEKRVVTSNRPRGKGVPEEACWPAKRGEGKPTRLEPKYLGDEKLRNFTTKKLIVEKG